MKVAFSYWDQRISPVFDNSRRILLVETEMGRIVARERLTLAAATPAQRCMQLVELGVNALVCGAISKSLQNMISAYGVQVIPFVAGELQQVLQGWQENRLETEDFRMPGCRCSGGTGKGRNMRQSKGLGMRRGRENTFWR